jgi:hypothetical protein
MKRMKSKSIVIAAIVGAAGLATFWAATLLNTLSLTLALRSALGTSLEVFTPAILLFILMLLIGFMFVWLRVERPLQVALAGSSAALMIFALVSQFVNLRVTGAWAVWLFVFVVAAVCFGGSLWANRFVKKGWLAWVAAAALGLLSAYVQVAVPPAPASAQSTEATALRDSNFARAVSSLDFPIHQPAYIPAGMSLGKPELWGYSPAFAQHMSPYVSYEMGPVGVQQGKVTADQEKIMNFKDVCDIEMLWASMASTAPITDEHAKLAAAKPSPCRLETTTPAGKKIYLYEKPTTAYAYVRLDDTNIVFKFDALKGKKYASDFTPELNKLVDSLTKVELSTLEQGEY